MGKIYEFAVSVIDSSHLAGGIKYGDGAIDPRKRQNSGLLRNVTLSTLGTARAAPIAPPGQKI
jgi:hypothetical protein